MQTRDYLRYIVEGIHSVVFATVDSMGRPVTCAIDIMDYDEGVAVSVQGRAREIGADRLADLFFKNPYMEKIYPDADSRGALTVFQIYEGTGEWFDLSRFPIERASFSFGGIQADEAGYFVTDRCIGCKFCRSRCPQACIDTAQTPAVIRQEHCLHCGNCLEICPVGAIERRNIL